MALEVDVLGMKRPEFEKLVKEGIEAIPEMFREKLKNVEICVEDWPNPQQLKKLRLPPDSILFGLYEGVPQTRRDNYGMVLPDKITIFQKPIERYASSGEAIREIVKNTVWHEIAHHFGFGERKIRELETNRRKQK